MTRLPRPILSRLITLVLTPATALAAGFGEMTSQSAIGEPFRAEFEVFGSVDDNCFRLAQSGLADGVPDLTGASVSVRRSNGKTYAVVARSAPVSDPIVRVTLEEICSARLSKTYTLLLPMTVARAQAAPPATQAPPRGGSSAAPRTPAPLISLTDLGTSFTLSRSASLNQLARTLYPSSRAQRLAFIAATRQLNSGDRSVRSSRRTIGAGSTLLLPAREDISRTLDAMREAAASERASRAAAARRQAETAQAATEPPPTSSAQTSMSPPEDAEPRESDAARPDRLVIMGATPEVSGFKMSTRLGDPSAVERTSDAEREVLRREQALIMALDSQIVARLELSERIERLEALQDVLRAEMAATPPGESQSAIDGPDNLASSPAIDTAPAGQPSAEIEPTPPREAPPVAAPARPSPSPAPAPAADDGFTWWPYAAGLLVALLLLLWWQRRRSEGEFIDYENMSEPEPFEPGIPDTSATVDETLAPDATSSQGQDSFDFSVVEWDGPPPADLDHTIAPVVLEDEEMVEEHESAVELADIMMSFGRVQGAAETLADFIRGNPKKAVQPWIKLLEVYKTANMRGEFDALSDKLNKTFNVKTVTWESFDRVKRASESVEQLPHILRILQSQWMTHECQIYVQKLLRDNRGGTREGFPLGIVDDLLTVQAILEDQLGPYRLSDEEIEAMIVASEAAQSAFGQPDDDAAADDGDPAKAAKADEDSMVDFDEFNSTDVEPASPEDTAFQDIFDSQSSTTLDLPDLDFQLEESTEPPSTERPASTDADDEGNTIEFERTQIFRKDSGEN